MVVWTAKKGLVLNNVKIIFDRITVQYCFFTPIVLLAIVLWYLQYDCIALVGPVLTKGFMVHNLSGSGWQCPFVTTLTPTSMRLQDSEAECSASVYLSVQYCCFS